MAKKFDIVILGGGNAGFGVSAIAHEAGKSVAFVEELDFGGTCPNRGCTPKKVLVAAAHAMHEISHASVHGIEVGKPVLNWKALISREKKMIGSHSRRDERTGREARDGFYRNGKIRRPAVGGGEWRTA